MDINIKTAFVLLLLFFISSCAGTKKIDFETAYKFSRYNYHKADDTKPQQQNKVHYASLDPPPVVHREETGVISDKPTDTGDNIYQKSGYDKDAVSPLNVTELEAKIHKLTRKEKREIRKEIRSELKNMKYLMAVNTIDKDQIQKGYASTDYTRLALIIGGAGLVLLILGAIFSGFLAFVGALAVVAAAVLFIIDQS